MLYKDLHSYCVPVTEPFYVEFLHDCAISSELPIIAKGTICPIMEMITDKWHDRHVKLLGYTCDLYDRTIINTIKAFPFMYKGYYVPLLGVELDYHCRRIDIDSINIENLFN